MKTKINMAIIIVAVSISLTACVEEEVKVRPPLTHQTTTGLDNTSAPINTHAPIK